MNSRATAGLSWARMASILLVTDDDWVRNDVQAAVADPATTLVVESDPRAVGALVLGEKFTWAIVDMQVGSMGGMAVVRLLRNAIGIGATEDMGIVLLLDREADRFLAGRADADASLVKPFTAQELRGCLAASTG